MKVQVPEAVLHAITNQDKVDEAPHSFYKYPARFSPAFAREAIKAFTREGETVLDPFCGGGTSLIEAMALGRRAAGFDISSLAVFLTRAKSTPISVHDKKSILDWLELIEGLDKTNTKIPTELGEEARHYQKNLPDTAREFFETIIYWSILLPKVRQRRFVRLVLLSVGQWAVDCKVETKSWDQFRAHFIERTRSLVEEYFAFITTVAKQTGLPRCRLGSIRRVINRTCAEGDDDGRLPNKWLPAKLVLTSPPYPGVHVLYHRWQVNGRRETAAPFWLANSRDGAGASYYCLGSRGSKGLKPYFQSLLTAFSSVRKMVGPNSIIAQLVAFSNPEWQLPLYLSKMQEAGYAEALPVCDPHFLADDGRIWRSVPGRRWYARTQSSHPASKEVFLIHKPA